MKPPWIVYGSWKMCMNTLVAQIDKMFSFVCKHIINLICRKFTFPPLLDLVLDSCLKSLYFLPFLNPHKNRCVWPAIVCKTVFFFSQSVLKDAEYGRRLCKINRVFFASLTSLISFLASLQDRSSTPSLPSTGIRRKLAKVIMDKFGGLHFLGD